MAHTFDYISVCGLAIVSFNVGVVGALSVLGQFSGRGSA